MLPSPVSSGGSSGWDGVITDDLASVLFTQDSEVLARYRHAKSRFSGPVKADTLIPGSRLHECPIQFGGVGFVLVPGGTYSEFGAFVGIKSTQHLGEVLQGKRRSCCHWMGGLFGSFHPRTMKKKARGQSRDARRPRSPYAPPPSDFFVAPAHPDRAWQEGSISEQLARSLLGQHDESPAKKRFAKLLVEHPSGVPIAKLFEGSTCRWLPDSRRTLLPRCKYAQFAEDVGVRYSSHFGEMLRGKRKTCHGWCGKQGSTVDALQSSAAAGVIPAQQTLDPVLAQEHVDPVSLDLHSFITASPLLDMDTDMHYTEQLSLLQQGWSLADMQAQQAPVVEVPQADMLVIPPTELQPCVPVWPPQHIVSPPEQDCKGDELQDCELQDCEFDLCTGQFVGTLSVHHEKLTRTTSEEDFAQLLEDVLPVGICLA